MFEQIPCPRCKQLLNVPLFRLGKKIGCEHCNLIFLATVNPPKVEQRQTEKNDYSLENASKPDDEALFAPRTCPENFQWRCRIDGDQIGPIPFASVRKLAVAGTLKENSSIQPVGYDKWIKVRDLNQLKSLIRRDPFNEENVKSHQLLSESEIRRIERGAWFKIIGGCTVPFIIMFYQLIRDVPNFPYQNWAAFGGLWRRYRRVYRGGLGNQSGPANVV